MTISLKRVDGTADGCIVFRHRCCKYSSIRSALRIRNGACSLVVSMYLAMILHVVFEVFGELFVLLVAPGGAQATCNWPRSDVIRSSSSWLNFLRLLANRRSSIGIDDGLGHGYAPPWPATIGEKATRSDETSMFPS